MNLTDCRFHLRLQCFGRHEWRRVFLKVLFRVHIYVYVLERSVEKLELAFLSLAQSKYLLKFQRCVIYFTWWTDSVASIEYWEIDKK